MGFQILEHTADLRMLVEEDEVEKLFAEALRGMNSILKSKITDQPRCQKDGTRNKIKTTAEDFTELLVNFLNEVLTLSQIHKQVYNKVRFEKLSERELEAELQGVEVNGFDEDIKAVTYHEADVKKGRDGKWRTILVFDI